MDNQSLLTEVTPSPILGEVTPSPIPEEDQVGIIPITFTSVEDLRENLSCRGTRELVMPARVDQRITEPEYQSVIKAMAPTPNERYKLKVGWDGERRWFVDKECNFQGHDVDDVPHDDMTRVKVMGQETYDIYYPQRPPKGQLRRMADKAYEAELKSSREDCRPQSELDKETPKRTFQRDLEPKKPKVQSDEPAEEAKVRAKTALEKRLEEKWPELARITPAAEPEFYADAMLRSMGMFPDRSQLAGEVLGPSTVVICPLPKSHETR